MSSRIIVVTGANKGIGREIVARIAKEYGRGEYSQCTQPLVLYLTARSEQLGHTTLRQLNEEIHHDQSSSSESVQVDLRFHQLDITKSESIQAFYNTLKRDHDGLDILVNNAGIASKGSDFNVEIARNTIGTNYFSTVNITKTLLPIIKPNGRVVNIGSQSARLSYLSSEQLRSRFTDQSKTEESISALMNEFISAVGDNTYEEKGWPRQSRCHTELIYTSALAHHARKDVNYFSCCPGWCRTDLAGMSATYSAEQGSDTPVYLALSNDKSVLENKGKFFVDRKVTTSDDYAYY
ncbi:hypothetical protein BDF22DRAFT_689704 [Syncephalis plumigaleata]|nr:hypothetical protein BDF22DRAFT_689704 [Syncephalis plumigaleata]